MRYIFVNISWVFEPRNLGTSLHERIVHIPDAVVIRLNQLYFMEWEAQKYIVKKEDYKELSGLTGYLIQFARQDSFSRQSA